MFVILLDTRSFSFMAIGKTEASARRALARGWRTHVRETGADPAHVNAEIDGSVFEVNAGECWRDDRVIARVK